jgi:phosphoribosylanthranilate isomerase
MRVRIKVCGITRLDDALYAAEIGVDMLALNFWPGTRRRIDRTSAQTLVEALRSRLGDDCPLLIGLFVNSEVGAIQSTVDQLGLDAVQLSGDEPPEMLAQLKGHAFRSIRPTSAEQTAVEAQSYHAATADYLPSLLVDAYHKGSFGGTGIQTSDAIALTAKAKAARLMLAGGLTPENVAARVEAVLPWGVDVASGVEDGTPGVKDHNKMKAFVQVVREVVGQV